MTRRRHIQGTPCDCNECAELDLACPGEGLQLAFPLPAKPRRRRTRQKEAVA